MYSLLLGEQLFHATVNWIELIQCLIYAFSNRTTVNVFDWIQFTPWCKWFDPFCEIVNVNNKTKKCRSLSAPFVVELHIKNVASCWIFSMDAVSVCLSIFIKIVQKGEMVGICFFTLLFSLQIFPPLAFPIFDAHSLSLLLSKLIPINTMQKQ